MRMRLFSYIAVLSILLSATVCASTGKSAKPLAAWALPGGKIAYLTPSAEKKIRVVDARGNYIGQYIGETGKGSILMPCDLVGSPDGWLFVLDRMKATVNVYDEDFDYKYSIGEKGTDRGQLKSPQALAIDGYGFIYVASNGNNRIEKFDSEGKHIATLEPEQGEGVGTEFKYVTAMAATPDGRLAVAVDADDPQLRRKLYLYDYKGELAGVLEMVKWGGQGYFSDLFINDDGTMLLVDSPGMSGAYPGSIWHIDKDGNLIRKYEAFDSDFDRYYSPVDVLVKDGQMFIFCSEKKCIVYKLGGGFLYSFGL